GRGRYQTHRIKVTFAPLRQRIFAKPRNKGRMEPKNNSYDVIIVGGRPAGASLAARLGAKGIPVLIVDKASFPESPEVPSCPVLYAKGMRLLDELGIDESLYAHCSTKIKNGVIEFDGYFRTVMPIVDIYGRDYIYGFERAGFDYVLWKFLEKY